MCQAKLDDTKKNRKNGIDLKKRVKKREREKEKEKSLAQRETERVRNIYS